MDGPLDNTFSRKASDLLVPVVLILCALVTCVVVLILAASPWVGARVRSDGSVIRVESVDPTSPAWQAGLRPQDTLLALDGSVAPVWFHENDPDVMPDWRGLDAFMCNQQRLSGSLFREKTVLFEVGGAQGRSIVRLAVESCGWMRAAKRIWPLLLVGWCFVLVPCLLWRRRRDETTAVNLVVGVGTFLTLASLAPFDGRDLSVENGQILLWVNYLAARLTTLMALHFGLVFPQPMRTLRRWPWVRAVPLVLFAVQTILHFSRIFPGPKWTTLPLSAAAMLGFLLLTVLRILRESDSQRLRQVQWIALAFLGGLLPWLALTDIPSFWGRPIVDERYTILFFGIIPVLIAFAIHRYRLLDVGSLFDWVVVHGIILAGFCLVEVVFWRFVAAGLSTDLHRTAWILSGEVVVLVLIYAPLRTFLAQRFARFLGVARPEAWVAQEELLRLHRHCGDAVEALVDVLVWCMRPRSTQWMDPSQAAMVARRELPATPFPGTDLGSDPVFHPEALWVPLATPEGMGCVLLHPGRTGWRRSDLRLAGLLSRSAALLLEAQIAKRDQENSNRLHRRDREETLREMHDGLGSLLFGLTLLSNPSSVADGPMRQKLSDIHDGAMQAMDALRTGLAVLFVPPGAFGAALLTLMERAERLLESAGIRLETDFEDELTRLRLPSATTFALLRCMLESITNAARHSRAQTVSVSGFVREGKLHFSLRDDGVGFDASRRSGGFGLDGMCRRMEELGGAVAIDSTPGCGVQVRLELDIGKDEKA